LGVITGVAGRMPVKPSRVRDLSIAHAPGIHGNFRETAGV
jgi:hypothetical protein